MPNPLSQEFRSIAKKVVVGAAVVLLLAAAGYLYARHTGPVSYSLMLPSGDVSKALSYGAWPALSNPDFYASVKQRLIESGASFIAADLHTMRLTVYEDGSEALSVPILAKGRKGSWWETPTGVYEINSREENHFSSFGKVYQPWSLAFQGNFFIHGWPYYPDGTEVSSSYSGGCIRLSTPDAEKVFELADVGMPVIVYDSAEVNDGFQYTFAIPNVSADAYLVADVKTGTVLAEKESTAVVPMASVTKLVTALIVTEYLNLDRSVAVPPEAIVKTSKPRLAAGQEISVHDLLYLLLRESSNEAAETLASALGRERFIGLMNKKAEAIGLTKTHLVDPSGSGDGNVTSAEDLFTLTKYIYDNRRFIFDITSERVTNTAYAVPAFENLGNFNTVPGVRNQFYGGKIGKSTAAHETYAGVFALSANGEERTVSVVALGSDEVYGDISRLLMFVNTLYASTP